jgi:hypothetical protein
MFGLTAQRESWIRKRPSLWMSFILGWIQPYDAHCVSDQPEINIHEKMRAGRRNLRNDGHKNGHSEHNLEWKKVCKCLILWWTR